MPKQKKKKRSRVAFLDIETTNFTFGTGSIGEAAIVIPDGPNVLLDKIIEWRIYISPYQMERASPGALEVNQLHLRRDGARPKEDCLRELFDELDGRVVMTWNGSMFDIPWLQSEHDALQLNVRSWCRRHVDMAIIAEMLGFGFSPKLDDVAVALDLEAEGVHTAAGGASLLRKVAGRLLKEIRR